MRQISTRLDTVTFSSNCRSSNSSVHASEEEDYSAGCVRVRGRVRVRTLILTLRVVLSNNTCARLTMLAIFQGFRTTVHIKYYRSL